jgi:hypothetical protein
MTSRQIVKLPQDVQIADILTKPNPGVFLTHPPTDCSAIDFPGRAVALAWPQRARSRGVLIELRRSFERCENVAGSVFQYLGRSEK